MSVIVIIEVNQKLIISSDSSESACVEARKCVVDMVRILLHISRSNLVILRRVTLFLVCLYFHVAIGATELPDKPLLKAVTMESMAAVWKHLYFLTFCEIGKADRAGFVLKVIATIATRGHWGRRRGRRGATESLRLVATIEKTFFSLIFCFCYSLIIFIFFINFVAIELFAFALVEVNFTRNLFIVIFITFIKSEVFDWTG